MSDSFRYGLISGTCIIALPVGVCICTDVYKERTYIMYRCRHVRIDDLR